jgi:hypothetical protein
MDLNRPIQSSNGSIGLCQEIDTSFSFLKNHASKAVLLDSGTCSLVNRGCTGELAKFSNSSVAHETLGSAR